MMIYTGIKGYLTARSAPVCLLPVTFSMPLTGVKKEKNDISKNVKQFRQQSCGGLSRITIFSKEVMLWLK